MMRAGRPKTSYGNYEGREAMDGRLEQRCCYHDNDRELHVGQ